MLKPRLFLIVALVLIAATAGSCAITSEPLFPPSPTSISTVTLLTEAVTAHESDQVQNLTTVTTPLPNTTPILSPTAIPTKYGMAAVRNDETHTATQPSPSTLTPTYSLENAPTITPYPKPTSTTHPTTATKSSITPFPSPSEVSSSSVVSVEIGDVIFKAEIANTPDKRAKGLSGRDALPAKTGMLFIFQTDLEVHFWMHEMRFALDFVWISSNCIVADITPRIPAPHPDMPVSELPTYTPTVPVKYTLEINAGETETYGIAIGDTVRIIGIPDNSNAC